MVLFNYALKELTAKIVYYGPGLSGKTTNLKYIHEELPIKSKGRMLTLATETDRTLYFDFLPVEAGIVKGIKTRIQLYTVPGQVFYNATRRMVLKGADGVVFVADSQKGTMEANLESMDNLRENLLAHDLRLEEIPFVLQYNKRDLEDALSIEEMNTKLNTLNVPFYAAVAIEGIGVEDTLKAVGTLVLKSVTEKYAAAERMAGPSRFAKRQAPASPAGEPLFLQDKTDPLASPQSVSAAAGMSGDVLATMDFDTDSQPDPLVLSGATDEPGAGEPSPSTGGWLSAPMESNVKSKPPDDSDSMELDNLNLEGILDEALKVEEQESAAEPAPLEAVFDEEVVSSSEEPALSGVLEDALGLDGPLGSADSGAVTTSPGSSMGVPIGEEEVNLLEDRFDALSAGPDAPAGPALDELARTQIATDLGDALDLGSGTPPKKESTSPVVRRPHVIEVEARGGATKLRQAVVPVHLTIDPTAEDVELLITLRVKIRRQKE